VPRAPRCRARKQNLRAVNQESSLVASSAISIATATCYYAVRIGALVAHPSQPLSEPAVGPQRASNRAKETINHIEINDIKHFPGN
jgi:hypothetical protein